MVYLQKNYDCPEPYVPESKLIKELLQYIQFTNTAYPQMIKQTDKLKFYMDEYRKTREMILLQQEIIPDHKPFDILEYAKFALRNGSKEEKREIVEAFGALYIHNEKISSSQVINQQTVF